MTDWLKLHRKILESDLWVRPLDFRIFLFLLLKANYQESSFKKIGVEIKRGQYLRSYRKLQEDLMYEENEKITIPALSSLYKAIQRLVDKKRITVEKTGLGTLFTIVNYGFYQSQKTDLRTTCEQPVNNNKEIKEIKEILNNKLFNIGDDFFENEIYPLVSEWKSYKKSRKESYKSSKSLGAFTIKLLTLSNSNPEKARQIIEQSMANNWAGIFELKVNSNTVKEDSGTWQLMG